MTESGATGTTSEDSLYRPRLWIGAAAFASGQEREQRTTHSFDVGGQGELSVSNISGDIVVTGGSGDTIEVEAIKRLQGDSTPEMFDAVQIDVSHTGDRVRVQTRYDEDGWSQHDGHKRGGVTVDYRVSVPADTEVELVSVSGDVELSGVQGESTVQSVSGDVRVEDSPEANEVKSVSGDVHVRGIRSGDSLEVGERERLSHSRGHRGRRARRLERQWQRHGSERGL